MYSWFLGVGDVKGRNEGRSSGRGHGVSSKQQSLVKSSLFSRLRCIYIPITTYLPPFTYLRIEIGYIPINHPTLLLYLNRLLPTSLHMPGCLPKFVANTRYRPQVELSRLRDNIMQGAHSSTLACRYHLVLIQSRESLS